MLFIRPPCIQRFCGRKKEGTSKIMINIMNINKCKTSGNFLIQKGSILTCLLEGKGFVLLYYQKKVFFLSLSFYIWCLPFNATNCHDLKAHRGVSNAAAFSKIKSLNLQVIALRMCWRFVYRERHGRCTSNLYHVQPVTVQLPFVTCLCRTSM